ncbi:conserved hypothetical protein [Rhodopseudomonas palustris HaA2]|uniref:Lipoprotein n=1 Tax=Rhodopseudomonas palustris (strain HaA2) TaxID=316058 RepID=Q2IVU0_RHOP2|nr:hypothetical protein [Rhodopseudomonas palustris]ABD07670.1 conserved hypothetical protein [Rhodopseudomonas palustris HaA2]
MPGANGGDRGHRRAGLAAAVLLAGLCLGGCSISLSDMPLMGASDKVEKPKEAEAFPAVNDLPANRDEAVLAPAERNKIEQELIAARERQANANASAAKPAAAK